ncbi:MAG TPA: tyrosine-type recombinase/integrase [Rubrivivax sp.]|nr:tyrosine-type recombinase/integrase [Rubrivivax sp.]
MRRIDPDDLSAAFDAETRRANRRRLLVFLAVFVLAAAVGLTWDFMRPAQYRATARLQITPPSTTLAPGVTTATVRVETAPADARQAFLTEVQTLSSRPIIERVAARLRSSGHELGPLGLDPILGLQSTLAVHAVEGTQVVELSAVGSDPELPAALLVGIGEVYREHLARAYRDSTTEAAAGVDAEVARLDDAVAAKRRAVEGFRVRYSIVSPEREENSVLAEMQGLTSAQKDASKRLTEAEGRVEALRAAAADGKGVVRAKDNPTLAALEARASQLREELRELGRRYTQAYLDMDPQARALRVRLSELDEQIGAQRKVSQSSALDEAEQELAAARESARRLQQQIAAGKQQVGTFAARFSQYKALQDELTQLEKAYQDALQRKVRLEATQRSRAPALQILEQAVIPKEPWRPPYRRDAALVLAAALALALGAMWLVELFNRPAPRPSVLVTQPVVAATVLTERGATALPRAVPDARLTLDDRARLGATPSLPRELTTDEALALLRSADADVRCAAALLLCGLSADEALAVRWNDVDAERGFVRVEGTQSRHVPLAAGTRPLLGTRAADGSTRLLHDAAGAALDVQVLATKLLVAAHDAGLERAHEVRPEALRHTYLAYVVRQGARLADVMRVAGMFEPGQLSAYSQLAPSGSKLDADAVQWTFPALREPLPGQTAA